MRPMPEFSSRAELYTHYRGVRARLWPQHNAIERCRANVGVEALGHGRNSPSVEPASRPVGGRAPTTTSENGRDRGERPPPLWPTGSIAKQIRALGFVRVCILRVGLKFGVPPSVILSPCRTADVVLPRQVAMFLIVQITRQSYPWTGRQFGRDHTTVLHGVRKIAARIETDPLLRETVDRLFEQLTATKGEPHGETSEAEAAESVQAVTEAEARAGRR